MAGQSSPRSRTPTHSCSTFSRRSPNGADQDLGAHQSGACCRQGTRREKLGNPHGPKPFTAEARQQGVEARANRPTLARNSSARSCPSSLARALTLSRRPSMIAGFRRRARWQVDGALDHQHPSPAGGSVVTICHEGFPRVLLRTVVPSELTGSRWEGLGAADPCQCADGQRGLRPR